ncbi:MAG: TIGR00730 family Rossman fold protein [Pseudomonadota bacterium]
MKKLCVYCGASSGMLPVYADGARNLARKLVAAKIALVYGGGSVGLMGVLADEVMRLGGDVTGVIPQALLKQEVGHHGLSRLHVVNDMHARKAMMMDLSDGFIAMPGGFGTLEELFEVLTWAQLGLHDKPIGLLNIDGFFDGLVTFVGHQVDTGFLRQSYAAMLVQARQPAELLQKLADFRPVHTEKILTQHSAAELLLRPADR